MLEVNHISKSFSSADGIIQAVNDVSFEVSHGQSVAIVGESGSGKTTTMRIALGLLQPDEGEVRFNKELVTDQHNPVREHTGLVFQNPYASLNPRWTVLRSISEPLKYGFAGRGRKSEKLSDEQIRVQVCEALKSVGLEPETFLQRMPQDMSGGQAQRVAMARALVKRPQLLVADEPMSAVDVSARITILKAFESLRSHEQQKDDMAMLLIMHDLGVARLVADKLVVMHNGKIVESGPTYEILKNPREAYTRELVQAAQW